MNKELRIEHYLLQLDRALHALPVSQRAEIVTEIKSHIFAVMEKDPQKDLATVLNDLGDASLVAERYLASKGIAPVKRSGSWLRYLAIAAAVCVGFVIFTTVATIWYISPLIKVDEAKGRVTLFGGLIDVNEKIGRVRVGGIEVNDALKENVKVSGMQDLKKSKINLVKIPFNTAKLNVSSSTDETLHWDCQAVGNSSPKAEVSAGILTLNLDDLNLAKCSISLPRGTSTEFKGVNGKIEVESPRDAMNINLTNGKVMIHPDSSRVYDFEVKVKNGLQDDFPRSTAKEAVKIKVDLVNGLVKNSD